MASYGYTFQSGDGVTPTRLNDARTVSDIVNADIKSDAAIALSKLATGALPSGITVASANLVDGTIVNADISASAAIALSKLATGALPTGITVASANLVDGSIVNADVSASAAIAHSKLANITAGQVLLGNASNVPTATALSGDVTVNSSGVTAIGSGVIVDADVNASAAIAGTKVSPSFGSQNIVTTGTVSAGAGSVISGSSSGDALRITQTGSGNALVVEDNTNPDSSPFLVDASGNVISGYTSTENNWSGIPSKVAIHGSTTNASYQAFSWSPTTANFCGGLEMNRSRGSNFGDRTVINANDDLGRITFRGSDGTAFIEAATIIAEVDGTPGTNDMPGRLVFSTTADGASTSTERLRITSSGDVVIGKATANSRLNIAAADSATTTYPLRIDNSLNNYGLGIGAYGMSNRVNALNQSIDYTVDIGDDLIINTNGSERMRINSNGNVGIGSASATNMRIRVAGSLTGGTAVYGLYMDPSIAPSATTSGNGIRTFLSTASNAGTPYTVSSMVHFWADQGTIHADSTVTSQYGVLVDSGLVGAANNYGVRSDIPAGTNRWNFYAGGTANNYFGGSVGIGATVPNAAAALQIDSTTRGFLPPRMTTTQRDAIATPPAGLMIYNTTTNKLNVRTASSWEAVTSS